MTHLRTLAAFVTSLGLFLVPSAATACLRDAPPPPMPMPIAAPDAPPPAPGTPSAAIALGDAEQRLETGALDEAIGLATEARASVERDPRSALAVLQLFGDAVGDDVVQEKADRLAARATLIEQIARSRKEGATAAERTYAAERLASLRASYPGLVTETTYAEVLSRAPGRDGEAYALLRGLAERDLLGSAWEHGALSRLAAARGDAALARAERDVCRSIATGPAACAGAVELGSPPKVALAYGGGAGLGAAALASVLVRRRRARSHRAERAISEA